MLLGVAIISPDARAADLTEEAKAARDFTFEKIKLGSSLKDFKKQFPNASYQVDLSDPKLKVAVFLQDSESAAFTRVEFLDEILYEIRVIYNIEKVNKLGGDSVLLDRLIKKFGKFQKDKDYEFKREPFAINGVWRFPEVDRFVKFQATEKFSRLDVTDMKLFRELQERKAKAAKTGFDD